jgi:enoyl-CoA hydratase
VLGEGSRRIVQRRKADPAISQLLCDPKNRHLEKLNHLIDQCLDSNDYTEGRRAFLEKRKPVFTGE